jgi:transposase
MSKRTVTAPVPPEQEGTSGSGMAPAGATPDPEVRAKPERRQFSAAYKLQILKAVEHCAPGEISALLRREGLYSSHLTNWRREQELGALQGLTAKPRGRRANPQAEEIARLQHENAALRARLQQAEAIIDAQKKLAEVLGPNRLTESNERHGSAS